MKLQSRDISHIYTADFEKSVSLNLETEESTSMSE